MANTACWLGRGARVPAAASAGQCSCRWHNSMNFAPFVMHISSSGGAARSKELNIVRNADWTGTRVKVPDCIQRALYRRRLDSYIRVNGSVGRTRREGGESVNP